MLLFIFDAYAAHSSADTLLPFLYMPLIDFCRDYAMLTTAIDAAAYFSFHAAMSFFLLSLLPPPFSPFSLSSAADAFFAADFSRHDIVNFLIDISFSSFVIIFRFRH